MMAEAPSADDGARLQALFDALDDDDARLASSDAEDFFPSRRRAALSGGDSDSYSDSDSDAHTDDSFWNEDSEDDQDAPWVLDSVRLFREQQASDLPVELAGGPVKAVELDAMFGYGVRPDPRMAAERVWAEDDEPEEAIVDEPAEPFIDADAEAEFIEASVPEADSDDDSETTTSRSATTTPRTTRSRSAPASQTL